MWNIAQYLLKFTHMVIHSSAGFDHLPDFIVNSFNSECALGACRLELLV